MKFSLSAIASAALVTMLGMAEGSTSSEVEDRLLTDAAARKNSFENDGSATKSEVEAFAAEIAALKAENAELKGASTQVDTVALDAANQLAETRATELAAANTRITELEAEIKDLGQKAEGGHTATEGQGRDRNNSDEVPSYMKGALTQRVQKMHSRQAKA